MQCVLVGITNMISDPSTIPLFHKLSETNPEDPYGPLIKCLNLQDEFSLLESLRILAVLISTDPKPLSAEASTPLLNSVSRLTNGSASPARDLAIQVLGAILSSRQIRKDVWKHENLLSGLIKALKTAGPNPSPQLQYWVILCFWELSYEEYVAEALDKRFDVIAIFTDIAKHAAKEKVVRMVIATFRNLLFLAPTENLPSMLVQQLLPFVTSLSGRKFQDEEIQDDIAYLKEELTTRLENLTTYDEYVSEVESGHLTWSAAHDWEEFWKENVDRIGEEDGGKVLKKLIALLSSSKEPIVLAVAAHDIGQYVKYGGDRARKLVTDYGGKVKVLELMTHESADVKYQALLTVS